MAENVKEFAELVDDGRMHAFYGVDGNKFKLGGVVFEAIEDENDGYRSYLDCIKRPENQTDECFRVYLGPVRVTAVNDGYFEGWKLIGEDGHEWLKVGTSNIDDYYPYFTCEYQPKPPEAA